MLNPDVRSLYTDALRPPPGFRFDEALATTYSLDLTTLLTIPLHLVLFSGEADPKRLLSDSVALLEALRRTALRLGIYCQQGQIHVPDRERTLFSLLDPVVVEARAPGGGAFHPKFWVLRFVRPESDDALLRLVVLTRNLTMDRSWDLALQLEGRPAALGSDTAGAAGHDRAGNRDLRNLVAALPRLAARPVPDRLAQQAERLADEIDRAEWELPEGFDSVRFHALGLRRQAWLPAASDRLAVISPFCTPQALTRLAETAAEPAALVARPEELAKLGPEVLSAFARRLVLDENAETEDGEDAGASSSLHGLHAKAYIARKGWYTRVYVGSANATDAALVHGNNVEVLAELVGKRSQVGEIDALLDGDGFGAILVDYRPPDAVEAGDPAHEAAERALDAAKRALGEATMRLVCVGGGDEWRLTLLPPYPVPLEGLTSIRAWPITLQEIAAVDARPLSLGHPVEFRGGSLASVVGFVAFELEAAAAPLRARFVLSLPVDGLPDQRDAAVVRSIIQDREGFLRYLILLLGALDGPAGQADLVGVIDGWRRAYGIQRMDTLPLLEEMTRALCRDPGRLGAVRRLVEDLHDPKGTGVVPPEFLKLWQVFESALEEATVERQPR